mgnify:CR=1 FL=1
MKKILAFFGIGIIILLLDLIFNYDEDELNIFISGMSLNTENLRVTSFCQEFKDPSWINKKVDQENDIKIENAILNKAKKLKLQSS